MLDRVSRDPGRVLITPENGGDPFYATLELKDNPTVEGTKLNKASLLTDAVAALYGFSNTAVPNDIFNKLIDAVIYTSGTLKKQNNSSISIPISQISGLSSSQFYVVGKYTGNGTYEPATTQYISLGFKPKALFISDRGNINGSNAGGFIVDYSGSNSTGITLTANGFGVTGSYPITGPNTNGSIYCYLAFKH